MKRQFVCALVIAGAVSACAQEEPVGQVWLRTDGKSPANDVVVSRQFEVDRADCSGGKAGYYNGVAGSERGAFSADVRGCMAQKGYVLVREDELQAKSAEFAAASDHAQREAAAKEPPFSVKRVASTTR
jgi:hypothetical protein